jgi:acyl-homoserine lactone acylase PvdQ
MTAARVDPPKISDRLPDTPLPYGLANDHRERNSARVATCVQHIASSISRCQSGATEASKPSSSDGARIVQSTGQSGNPFDSHYGDLIDEWADGRNVPLYFSQHAIEATLAKQLTLIP